MSAPHISWTIWIIYIKTSLRFQWDGVQNPWLSYAESRSMSYSHVNKARLYVFILSKNVKMRTFVCTLTWETKFHAQMSWAQTSFISKWQIGILDLCDKIITITKLIFISVMVTLLLVLYEFMRGSRKFCQKGVQLWPHLFRGEKIQIPLTAGHYLPASETHLNGISLAWQWWPNIEC